MSTSMDVLSKAVLAQQLRRDPPRVDFRTGREEERVKLVGTCQSEGVAVAGVGIGAGPFELEVYTSQVPEVRGLLETWLREPIRQDTMRVRERIVTTDGGGEPRSVEHHTMDFSNEDQRKLEGAEREAAAAENRRAVARDMARAAVEYEAGGAGGAAYRRPYIPSEPASFRAIMGRDMRPFTSLSELDASGATTKQKR